MNLHKATSKRRRVGPALEWTLGKGVWGEQEAWRVSTAHLQATYPARASATLGTHGIYIGRDLSGGAAFVHDPWAAYNAGVAMGANMMILGALGQGKSGLIKRRALRQRLRRDRRVEITDVKDEYGPLMEAVDGESLALYRGGPTRLNPMRPGPDGTVADELMRGVAGAATGRALTPAERAGLDAAVELVTAAAVGENREPTVPELVKLLLAPTAGLTDRVAGESDAEVRKELRELGLALKQLVDGPMSGMFDGPTTAALNWNAPAVRLDLSQVRENLALGVLMVAWMAFLRQAHETRAEECKRLGIPVPKTERDNDEAWRPAAIPGIAETWVSEYKLSRSTGTANLLAFHKLSDISAGVADGTAAAKLLDGLFEDTGTIVMFKHKTPEAAHETASRLGHGSTVEQTLMSLRQDQALWQIGPRLWHVHHETTAYERSVTYTDAAMQEHGTTRSPA
jgi:hypothetical protein